MGVSKGDSGEELASESPRVSLTAVPDPAIAILPPRGPGRLELSATYAALFLGIGVYQPFFPVFLTARGLSPEAIGLAIAVPTLVRLAAGPLVGALWDRVDRPRALLALLGLGGAAGFALVGMSSGVAGILLAVGFSALFWTPIFALLDAFAVRLGRVRPVDYGRARLWGSAAYIAGNLAAGAALAMLADAAIVWLIAAPFLLFALAALALPALPPARAPHPASHGGPFVSRRLVLGIAAAALIQASHALFYALGAVQWSGLGYGAGLIGFLWSLGVMTEIVLFTYSARVLKALSPLPLIALGGLAALVRFAAMALDPEVAWLFPLQALHALSFGATHLGLVALIAASVPDRALGRAQGFASSAVGIVMALATLASGPLYARYGALAYLSSAAIGALGGIVALAALASRPAAQRQG